MKQYRFDREAGTAIEQFGSTKAIISKIVHLEGEVAIHCAYIRPKGKIGFHQAVTQQLFLVVKGNRWVRSEADKKISIKEGQAVFWEKTNGTNRVPKPG